MKTPLLWMPYHYVGGVSGGVFLPHTVFLQYSHSHPEIYKEIILCKSYHNPPQLPNSFISSVLLTIHPVLFSHFPMTLVLSPWAYIIQESPWKSNHVRFELWFYDWNLKTLPPPPNNLFPLQRPDVMSFFVASSIKKICQSLKDSLILKLMLFSA